MANITIKEGGRAYPFAPAKLRTLLSGGGEALWVPESAITRDALSVTKNGDYHAAAEGLYAYSRVSVNVTQTDHVSGKGQDGNDYNYTVDPTTGDLVETKIPSSIRVTTPPTSPEWGYVDGEAIGKAGMVVTAYDANNTVMQTVPNGEITLEPSVAAYNATGRLTITAQWPRTGDAEILTAMFEITVMSGN